MTFDLITAWQSAKYRMSRAMSRAHYRTVSDGGSVLGLSLALAGAVAAGSSISSSDGDRTTPIERCVIAVCNHRGNLL